MSESHSQFDYMSILNKVFNGPNISADRLESAISFIEQNFSKFYIEEN